MPKEATDISLHSVTESTEEHCVELKKIQATAIEAIKVAIILDDKSMTFKLSTKQLTDGEFKAILDCDSSTNPANSFIIGRSCFGT
jgi:hypothetical protein